MKYGYIDKDGVLQSKELKEKKEPVPDINGKLIFKIETVDEQIEKLSALGWKPVDEFEEEKCKADNNYTVNVIPFDAGDRISFKYEKVITNRTTLKEIEALKEKIAVTDYKITKCYEYFLVGKQLPYAIEELHEERKVFRDEINNLEELIK